MTAKRSLRTQLALVFLLLLGGMLLFSVPFGLALEVHHVFSEIDHDGHEHAKHDLCTWVEHHVGSSYVQDSYRARPSTERINLLSPLRDQCVHSLIIRVGQSRAPPFS